MCPVFAEGTSGVPSVRRPSAHTAVRPARLQFGSQGGEHVGDEVLLRSAQSGANRQAAARLREAENARGQDSGRVRSEFGHHSVAFMRFLSA